MAGGNETMGKGGKTERIYSGRVFSGLKEKEEPSAMGLGPKCGISPGTVGSGSAPPSGLRLSFRDCIAWGIAKDPPSPDPQFRETVIVIPRPLPSALHTDTQLAPLKTVLEIENRILADQIALSQIESRLLGAKLAQDRKAIQMQKAAYRRVVREMAKHAKHLPPAIEAAEETIGLIDSKRLADMVTLWQQGGVPAEAQSNLAEAGMSDAELSQLDEAIRDPIFANNVKLGLGHALWGAAVAVKVGVDRIQRETPLKLARRQA